MNLREPVPGSDTRAADRVLDVWVAHPGTQHSHQTARALQEAGMLGRYITGFYYKTHGVLAFLAKLAPNRLGRQLARRRRDGLDERLIHTFSWLEWLYVLSARLALTRPWSGQMVRWRNRRFERRVARQVEARRPDAVVCYDSCALDVFEACKKAGAVAILDQSVGHLASGIEILRDEAARHPEFVDPSAQDVPGWLVESCKAEAMAADCILAASDYVRDTLVNVGVSPSRIAILPYGVDTARFHPVARADDGVFRILFVGGISQRKGVQYLLEACKQLDLPGMELVLAGTKVVEERALEPYQGVFRHVCDIPHSEIHTVFQSADIFVYPSLHEGSALAIYEALASGLPVITTHNAGSVVRDGVEGYIVPIRDVAALKEKIQLLYTDKTLRQQLGRQARQRAEDFTWQVYRSRLAALVDEHVRGARAT